MLLALKVASEGRLQLRLHFLWNLASSKKNLKNLFFFFCTEQLFKSSQKAFSCRNESSDIECA
jgi:hypothetical protein